MYHDVAVGLMNCINDILKDGCPGNGKYQMCQQAEEFDEETCNRCWIKYTEDIANGVTRYIRPTSVIDNDWLPTRANMGKIVEIEYGKRKNRCDSADT